MAYCLRVSGKTRKDLAAVLRSPKSGEMGVSVAAVGQVINGESTALNAENTARAARFFGVDCVWLAIGEGDMLPRWRPFTPELMSELAKSPPEDVWSAENAVRAFLRMDPLPRPSGLANGTNG